VKLVNLIMAEADKRSRAIGSNRGLDSPIHDQELRCILEVLLEAIHAAEPVRRGSDHAPILTKDLARIIGCVCGWKTPPDATDSDTTYTWHVALARVTEGEA
jgi:hypothetical protein